MRTFDDLPESRWPVGTREEAPSPFASSKSDSSVQLSSPEHLLGKLLIQHRLITEVQLDEAL